MTSLQTSEPPRLTFAHAGQTRTLNKHPRIQLAVRRSQMTAVDAAREPWYLRAVLHGKSRTFTLPIGDKDAIRAAKDILNGATSASSSFAEFLAQRDAKRGVTLGELTVSWLAGGLPFSKTKARTVGAAAVIKSTLTRALIWWEKQVVVGITPNTMEDFVVWRRAHVARGTGDRSADLELAALSSLCQWAVLTGRIPANPFAKRPQFHDAAAIVHCHTVMPDSDEQLHRLWNWFWTVEYDQAYFGPRHSALEISHRARIAGAWLAFTALTGLRPEEPQELFVQPLQQSVPLAPDKLVPGTVFPTHDGHWKMRVVRYKHGQNPYVILQPSARAFLEAWTGWLHDHFQVQLPAVLRLFPHPKEPTTALCATDTTVLNKLLARACIACGITNDIRPKGMGRAYYVRVRRSQGADDATIAGELGQTTNGRLIRTTYGNPTDMLGGALFDWLPEADGKTLAPAWEQLRAKAESNIIAL